MIVKYEFSVPNPGITIPVKYKELFGRTEVPYGKYIFRFNRSQIEKERMIQTFLKEFPMVQGKLSMVALEDWGA